MNPALRKAVDLAVWVILGAIVMAGFYFATTKIADDTVRLLVRIGGAAFFAAWLYIVWSGSKPPRKVTAQQLPTIVMQLHNLGKDGSSASFTFTPRGGDEEVTVHFSIVGGTLGLDWLYWISERRTASPSYAKNAADREKFAEFARKLGYEVVQKEEAYAKYLRIERGGSLPQLAQNVMKEIYGLQPGDPIALETDGFRVQA